MAVELDEIDVELLTALQEDADRTNVELARLTGLSPAATLHRVRRLKESGVIRIISAQLDPAAAGFPLQVYVTATLARHDPRSSRIFDDEIRSLPQIIAADNVAGETDYLLSVVARDVSELQEVLASLATRGGSRLVTYLRLAESAPPPGKRTRGCWSSHLHRLSGDRRSVPSATSRSRITSRCAATASSTLNPTSDASASTPAAASMPGTSPSAAKCSSRREIPASAKTATRPINRLHRPDRSACSTPCNDSTIASAVRYG